MKGGGKRSPPPSSAPNTLSSLSCPLTSPMRISPHLPRAPATLPPAANAPTRPDRHPHSLRAPPSPAGPARTVTSNVPHPHPPAHADIPHNCKQGKEEMRNRLRDRVKRWVYSSFFAWNMGGALAVEANWRAKRWTGAQQTAMEVGIREVDRRSPLPTRTSDFRLPLPLRPECTPRARRGYLIHMMRVRGGNLRASSPLERGRTLTKLGLRHVEERPHARPHSPPPNRTFLRSLVPVPTDPVSQLNVSGAPMDGIEVRVPDLRSHPPALRCLPPSPTQSQSGPTSLPSRARSDLTRAPLHASGARTCVREGVEVEAGRRP
ncbi:hypothetical protein DFH08DRAFT_1079065 [Mycena albidolilacea]|uniref:Uncharacterized protein n=1 Tax=Mycena albidolilacea TaxID=1033008 RepID=A0AAD7ETF2_9AGAR|nr:hypothetical protein DFH08DRAFT_1079065 [Mycena albidolilacea]